MSDQVLVITLIVLAVLLLFVWTHIDEFLDRLNWQFTSEENEKFDDWVNEYVVEKSEEI